MHLQTIAAAVFVCLITPAAVAQRPFLVTDLNTSSSSAFSSSSPVGFVDVAGTVYFTASTERTNNRELWMLRGEQASLVADIVPTGESNPHSVTPVRDDLLFFSASTPEAGRELWATDGTTAGTRLVKDIYPSSSSSHPASMVAVNGRLFFTANDGVHGYEPWVSDGTPDGTRWLVDLPSAGSVVTFAQFGSGMLLLGSGGIWSSDGTPEGTTPIVPASTLGSIAGFVRINSVGYFTATAEAGRELWRTDGTAAGTYRVKDIAPGVSSGVTSGQLVARNGFVYFFGSESGSGYELWKSDGTVGGTQRVRNGAFVSGVDVVPELYDDGSLTYVFTYPGLWRSDGTSAGTYEVESAPLMGSPVVAFGGMYYIREGDVHELWTTDGTIGGTRQIHRFAQGVITSGALHYTGGRLYFAAHDPLHGREPWVCTDAGGSVVKMAANVSADAPPGSDPDSIAAAGGLLYFTATDGIHGLQLWRTDGTAGGTLSIPDPSASPALLLPEAGWADRMYLRRGRTELWKSDGTVHGTALLHDFRQGYNTPSLGEVFPGSSFLYMSADDGSGSSLWRTDGTSSGTMKFEAARRLESPKGFTELARRTYFTATDGDRSLYVTEGTAESTLRVAPFNALTVSVEAAIGAIYFAHSTTESGTELWNTDGTGGGTSIVADIAAGPADSFPEQLVAGNRYLFFVADDRVHGKEVWRTDGTAAGTILLADVHPGLGSSSPRELTANGDYLYFVADDGVSGAELWRSDGTSAGTTKMPEIRTGAVSSNPRSLRAAAGSLWFAADDGIRGSELWRTTSAATVGLVADLEPGAAGSEPSGVVQSGNLLYFSATTPLGRELWAIAPATMPLITIDDVRVAEGDGPGTIAHLVLTRHGDTSAASTVAYTTSNHTATAPQDYVAASGTVTFGVGVTSRSIDISVNGDTASESNEVLFVRLSNATNAVLSDDSANVIVEDDDRVADLSVELLRAGRSRSIRITNNGPSPAWAPSLTYSESPMTGTLTLREELSGDLTCHGRDMFPVYCRLSTIPAGEAVTLAISSSYGRSLYTDPINPPGLTVTASVQAREDDPVAANNQFRKMLGAGMELPSFLTNGVTAAASYRPIIDVSNDTKASLAASEAGVTITPSTVQIPAGQEAAFSIQPNYVGRVRLTATWWGYTPQTITIESVAAGSTAKLDVGAHVPYISATYGDPVDVPVEIAGVMENGTRPTGSVTLFDAAGNQIAAQSLDGKAIAALRNPAVLPPGRHQWKARYSGDANFNGLDGIPVQVTVDGMSTATVLEIPPYFCSTAEVVVRVRNTATDESPAGTVRLWANGQVIEMLTLAPSTVTGESFATVSRTFANAESSYLEAVYYPSSPTFVDSRGGDWYTSATCAAFNLIAAANGPNVSLTWTPQTGAHHYEVLHAVNRSSWLQAGTPASASFQYVSGYTQRVLLYVVKAVDAAGNVISQSRPDLAYVGTFSHDPIIARTTRVAAVHVTELQTAIESMNILVSVAPVFSAALRGDTVRGSSILELRNAISTYRSRLALPPVTFTDPTLTGRPIKAIHMQQLRDALK